jgi:hypothetical protein
MDRARGDIIRREIAYSALPSQKRFHNLKTTYKGFSGPIGSGKSQALCQEAIRLSYLNPGRLGLLGAPTYPMLRDATQATLFEILEANGIPYDHNKAENTVVIQDTRSRILFRPVEEFERLRGTNLAWFGVDELTYTQEESWLRLEGRLRDPKASRLCGFAVWTPKGYDWVYRKFITNRKPAYGVVLASPMENRHLLDKVPDFYERLKDSYDETFFQQEVMGQYLNMDGGRVYSAFDRNVHVADVRIEPNVPLLWTLDFNVDPMSSVVTQSVRGKLVVVDEIVLRHATTEQACEEFLKRFPNHRGGVIVYGDAAGLHKQTTGSSDYEILRDMLMARCMTRVGYQVPFSNPAVRDRINIVNAKLRSASGVIGVTIDPRCKELIRDLEEVCYKATSNQIDKDKDRLRTHLSDALGYLIVDEFGPAGKIGPRHVPLL